MDLFLTILNHGGAVFLLLAIFGIEVTSFVLRNERALPSPPGEPEPEPAPEPVPLQWVFWQDLGEIGYEIHLNDGAVWRMNRSGTGERRYPDGKSVATRDPEFELLRAYHKQIEWKTPEALAKHAHVLVSSNQRNGVTEWRLLNGSTWSREGDRWHRVASPEHLVFEALKNVFAALDKHESHLGPVNGPVARCGLCERAGIVNIEGMCKRCE